MGQLNRTFRRNVFRCNAATQEDALASTTSDIHVTTMVVPKNETGGLGGAAPQALSNIIPLRGHRDISAPNRPALPT